MRSLTSAPFLRIRQAVAIIVLKVIAHTGIGFDALNRLFAMCIAPHIPFHASSQETRHDINSVSHETFFEKNMECTPRMARTVTGVSYLAAIAQGLPPHKAPVMPLPCSMV